MLSAVFIRRLILSVSRTVFTLKTKPHLQIAAHTVHTVRWFGLWGMEVAGDHSRSQASFLPCTSYSPVTTLQIQSLLHLTPAGRGDRITRVMTCMVTGTGFDPLPGLGVFPHGLCLPHRLAGLAITRVTHLGVWLLLLSGLRPGPLAQAQGAPYQSPALLRVPRLLHRLSHLKHGCVRQ